ncbi:MAG: hypothetical protein CMP48_18965 [Rickettsiales bacterium]|nr:hypothetical protein [Rickettsiales bacterium]
MEQVRGWLLDDGDKRTAASFQSSVCSQRLPTYCLLITDILFTDIPITNKQTARDNYSIGKVKA